MRSSRHQRAWYFYDWANSAYATTTLGVLISPYLTSVAKAAACPGVAEGEPCRTALSVLGVPIAAGSLSSYTTTVMTILSAVILLFVGAAADRSSRPHWQMGVFAWLGAAAACAMYFIEGTDWQLGVALLIVSGICLGASMVIYDGILVRIATPDERDRVSSRGWAFGYAAGFILLALNLGLLTFKDSLGISTGMAVRINLLSAGLWWAAFTFIPVFGLHGIPGAVQTSATPSPAAAVRQLVDTFKDLRLYPQTLTFLVAYMFFNDGVQTVISSASLYGVEELQMSTNNVMLTYLVVQLVAVFGALGFGLLAGRLGAWRTVLLSLLIWLVIVVSAYFVPAGNFGAFLLLGCAIGVVLGGTQALARSMYSQLVPRGRESEFFAFYQAMERGTSWFGTLTFGLVYQFTHSYRWAIVMLVFFFVIGGAILSRVRMAEGIAAAGNRVPAIV